MANAPIETGNTFCLQTDHDPGPLDSDYGDYFFWMNLTTGDLFYCVDLTEDNAVWKSVTLT
jgi:uncharacterized protein (DUF2249 family)